MKLTIYLLRESVKTFANVIPAKYRGYGGYVQLPPRGDLGFTCEAWVLPNKKKPPQWVPWLQPGFQVDTLSLLNQSNSIVLLVQVDGRIFGVTFGYGFNAIDRALVEPDFGLRVTLNSVNPDDLDTLDTRTVDRITRQRKTHLNVGRPVGDFDISIDLDWIRTVSGKPPASGSLARRFAGSDSLKVTWDCEVSQLAEKCHALLETYGKDTYKARFGFIDYLRPLNPKDPVVPSLNAELIKLLKARDQDLIAFAFPEIPDDRIESWKLWHGHHEHDTEELDLMEVYAFFDGNDRVPVDPSGIHVLGLDADNGAVTQKASLRRYLVAQVVYSDQTYILSLDQWFRADADYVKRIRNQLRSLSSSSTAVASRLNFPKWGKKQKEKEYNKAVGKKLGWLVLDCIMFHVEGRDGKLEVCDLLTPSRDFVHVKDMKDSATLSHLFGQGSVSAETFRGVPTHAGAIKSRFDAHYGQATPFDARTAGPCVVYAIATTKAGDLADTMFFFSAVNLLQHIQRIRVLGFEVALCRIEKGK